MLGNQVVELPGTFDQISYHLLSQRVLTGHGFSFGQDWWPATRANEPTAHWSYFYTFYLVGIYKIFGINPIAARLVQAIITGLLQPLLGYAIGKRLFNIQTALVSAGWFAVYPYFIYYGGTLMTEMFYITAILAIIWLSLKFSSGEYNLFRSISLGVLLGLTILMRQLFLLFVPFLFVWILWASRKRNFRLVLTNLVIAGAICTVMILPFTYYNYTRFHRFVLLNTNAGYVLYWGNHPIHGTHFVPILTADMPSYYDLLPKELLYLDEAALDQAVLQRGLDFIKEDPSRYLQLSLSRIPPYFMFWYSGDSGLISNLSRIGSFGVALPFILIGIWSTLRKFIAWKADPITSPVTLPLLFSLVYSGIHILTWTLVRYRLPVDAALLPFAALGLASFYHFIRARIQQ
jgi:4-amino-4-deoxy-L-arabinose transferase-like glycosyltransferase